MISNEERLQIQWMITKLNRNWTSPALAEGITIVKSMRELRIYGTAFNDPRSFQSKQTTQNDTANEHK